MMSFSDDKQAETVGSYNTTSRYLDDILNINNIYFDNIIKYTLQSSNLIIPIPLIPQLRFWTCICPFLMILFLPKFMIDMTILIMKLLISYFLNGDVPRSSSYEVYISQFIRFARLVADLYTQNKLLTKKLLKQGFAIRNFAN